MSQQRSKMNDKNIHLKTKLFQCNLCNFESLKLRVLKKHFENSHLLPTISKNIQKKRQIKSNKNNSKRNIFLKSQEFSRKKERNRDNNTQIIRTDDEEKIRNPGKRKKAPNSNELTYPGEVKKSLNNQRKSDELVVPEASKDHCPQKNSKIMESNSQDIVSIITYWQKCRRWFHELKSIFLAIYKKFF